MKAALSTESVGVIVESHCSRSARGIL